MLLQFLQTLEQGPHRQAGVIARFRLDLCASTLSQACRTGFNLGAVALPYTQRFGSRILCCIAQSANGLRRLPPDGDARSIREANR
ncbi:hypothetical protein D3C73_1544290 [compost metagenome]